jgi:hypothetical protein
MSLDSTRNRTFGVSKDAHRGSDRQTFRERGEHFTNPLRRRFQPIQPGMAARTEFVSTRDTTEILNRLIFAMMPIPDQGMNPGVGDTAIFTIFVVTGIAIGVNLFRATARAFDFPPGSHRGARSFLRGGR